MIRGIRGLPGILLAIFLAASTVGCEKRCLICVEDGPTTPTCAYVVTPTAQHFPYQGGAGNVVVNTQSGCSWTALSNAPWITITSGSSGSGNGSTTYTVAVNSGPARISTLIVAGQTVTITQEAGPQAPQPTPPPNPQPTPRPPQPTPQPTPPTPQSTPVPTPQPTPTPPPIPSCTYAVGAPPAFTYQGGNGGFNVSTSRSDCSWTAVSNAGWIEITSGSSGTGNGTVSFRVGGNPGPARTGTISVAGKTVTISQGAQ
jgi:hypothetical protein